MILLDTHVWIWWLLGTGQLSTIQRNKLDELAQNKQLALSWVSIWEAEMLERKSKISLNIPFDEWISKASSSEFMNVIGVDTKLVLAQRELPESFHADPADRLIVTTAKLLSVPLATFDSKIIFSKTVKIWS